MEAETDLLRPSGIFASWLAAAWAFPSAVVLAGLGQGVGAMLGGCAWIGLSLPVDRPVWALVNQPLLSFAASISATGYWLGSLALPATVAALGLGFVPRPRTFAAEIGAIQVVWASTVVGVTWLPLLDASEGHLARWLHFRELPDLFVLGAPAGGAALALLPTLHLLALQRSVRRDLGRGLRMLTVLLHLGVPATAWMAVSMVVAGRIQIAAVVATAVPVLCAVAVSWFGYPGPHPRTLSPISGGSVVRGVLSVALLISLLWLAGRPLSGGRCSGILWAAPTSTNNIRSWIDPLTTADLVPGRSSDVPSEP